MPVCGQPAICIYMHPPTHPHTHIQARNAERIDALIEMLAEMGEYDQNQFLASLSAADRAGIESAMRQLDAASAAGSVGLGETGGVAETTQVDVYVDMLAAMSESEQDTFLQSLSADECAKLRAELQQGKDERFYDSTPPSSRRAGSQVSQLASSQQQSLAQASLRSHSERKALRDANEDAKSQRYTGSELRIRQQLGLAPTGEWTDDMDHLTIPQPSEAEITSLQQLGYQRSQAALICMVDALTKQGYTPAEAQAHVTKAAARNLAGWYLDAGADPQPHQAVAKVEVVDDLLDSQAPARVPLPLNSIREVGALKSQCHRQFMLENE